MTSKEIRWMLDGVPGFQDRLEVFFLSLNKYQMVFIKTQTPHFPANFPEAVPVGKDVDLFVLEEDYPSVVGELRSLEYPEGIQRFMEESYSNFRVRFEIDLKLFLQIDVSKTTEYIPAKFVQGAVNRRVLVNNIPIPATSDELVFRVADLLHRPLKKHHHAFILRNYFKVFSIARNELHGALKMACSILRIPVIGLPLFVFTSPPAIRRISNYISKWVSFSVRHPSHILQVELPIMFVNQFNSSGFTRMDSIVRLLAMEEVKGENNVGLSMYEKMQRARSNGFNDGAIDRFKGLIGEMSTKGYDPYSPIMVDSSGGIIDGSHRFACALYFGEKLIPVNRPFKNRLAKRGANYDLEWFKKNCFTQSELQLIKEKADTLINELCVFFHAIIWGPAVSFSDSIVSHIGRSYQIREVLKLNLRGCLQEFVSKIYACDDIESWKVQRKALSFESVDHKVVIVKFFIPDPRFRRKAKNGHLISQEVEELKSQIRQRFKSKVDKYVYDNIIHIEDNFDHSRHMEAVITQYSRKS